MNNIEKYDGVKIKCNIYDYKNIEAVFTIQNGRVFICQDHYDGVDCKDKKGYKYSYALCPSYNSKIGPEGSSYRGYTLIKILSTKPKVKTMKHLYVINNRATFTETVEEAHEAVREALSCGEEGYVCANVFKITARKAFATKCLTAKKKTSTKKAVVKKTVKDTAKKSK